MVASPYGLSSTGHLYLVPAHHNSTPIHRMIVLSSSVSPIDPRRSQIIRNDDIAVAAVGNSITFEQGIGARVKCRTD